jgi:hypothetical protein
MIRLGELHLEPCDNPKLNRETRRKGGTMQRIRLFPGDDEGLHDRHDPGRLHRHH